MSKKAGDYWQNRFIELENRIKKEGIGDIKDLERRYQKAIYDVQKDLNVWYSRLAKNNGDISLVEARKLLNKNELEEFHWTVDEYIKHGRENALNKAWIKELENASTKTHIKRLEAIKLQTRQRVEELFAGREEQLAGTLKGAYKESFYRTGYELAKGTGVAMSFSKLDDNLVEKIIKTPWAPDGASFSSRIWKDKARLITELQAEVDRVCIAGVNPKSSVNNIVNKLNASKANAKRLVMTELSAAQTRAQQSCMSDIGVERYKYVATLDLKTSEICAELDGKIFEMQDMQIGVNAPPMHPHCRSCTCPDISIESAARMARSPKTGKSELVESMNYQQWKEKYVDESDPILTKASQKDKITSKDSVMKNLPDISNVKSNNDVKAFAERLIDNLGIDRTNISVKLQGTADSGHCTFKSNTTRDIIHFEDYVLNANDKRSMAHRIKTAFHESFHLSAEGMAWDGLDSSGRIKEVWRSLEETFTESSAHYMLERYGVKEKIAPSYAKELATNLPRLKQLEKYSSCNTIQDFGEIAFKDRQSGVGAKWVELSKKMNKVKLSDDYYKQYHAYIKDNEDDLFDMFLGNMPGFEQYRSSMKIDLKSAMNKDRILLNDNEQTVYYGIISCVMQKVGVK